MSALLVARDLARTYQIGRGPWRAPRQLRAVGGVSFEIAAGRTLAVVGETGCGKSTLARMLTLIERPSAGSLLFDGVDAINMPPGAAPHGSLNPRRTVGVTLEEPLAINTDLPRMERRRRALAMMAKVGLPPEHHGRYPHMFSGGQRQRIAIARALMLGPKLMVADEPVSALDVSVQAQVLNLFKDLQEEMGLAYLFISHDLAVVRHVAHEVLVMYLGLAMEQGARQRIFARPLHPYTQALLAATPGLAPRAARLPTGDLPSPLDPPGGCVFSTRCPHVVERCRTERPQPRAIDGRQVACHLAERFVAGGGG
jgi:dipeptide transport system ATP-binding protein